MHFLNPKAFKSPT